MSVVSIIVSDVDVLDRTYKVEFKIADSLIDDGQATAAAFAAYYLQSIHMDAEFQADIKRFGDNLITMMESQNPDILNTIAPAKVVVKLEDVDLARGMYSRTITTEGGDPKGESLPTVAQIVGTYIYNILFDMGFSQNCWKFAEEFVSNNSGSSLANADERPATLDLEGNAARYAA